MGLAVLKLTDDSFVMTTPQKGVRWHLRLTGELEPASKEEAAKASRIARVMLNPKADYTPQSYRDMFPIAVEKNYKSTMGMRNA